MCLQFPQIFSPDIKPHASMQVEALRLALEVAPRTPGLVALLQAGGGRGGHGEGDAGAASAMRRGVAVALRGALAAGGAALDNLDDAAMAGTCFDLRIWGSIK